MRDVKYQDKEKPKMDKNKHTYVYLCAWHSLTAIGRYNVTLMITLSLKFSPFLFCVVIVLTERGERLHQYVENSPKCSCAYADVHVKK